MNSLKDLFNKETAKKRKATDKNQGRRSHASLYETILEPYRNLAKKVFEVGIRNGGSIRVWRNYFPNAVIYALDNHEPSLECILNQERIIPVKLDQGSPKQLDSFAKNGPFDIGIDDGSHIWKHQILTFEKLWPAIKPGGLYIIEDIITSYNSWMARHEGIKDRYCKNSISCVNYFKYLIDEINFHGADVDTIDEEEWSYYQLTVDWICFRNNSIFLRKRVVDFDKNA
ncbi:MAG: hypothetical protein ACFFBP_20935 [Promethearchaeota archaeon]